MGPRPTLTTRVLQIEHEHHYSCKPLQTCVGFTATHIASQVALPSNDGSVIRKVLIVRFEDCIDGGKQRFALFQHQLGHTYGLRRLLLCGHYDRSTCITRNCEPIPQSNNTRLIIVVAAFV